MIRLNAGQGWKGKSRCSIDRDGKGTPQYKVGGKGGTRQWCRVYAQVQRVRPSPNALHTASSATPLPPPKKKRRVQYKFATLVAIIKLLASEPARTRLL